MLVWSLIEYVHTYLVLRDRANVFFVPNNKCLKYRIYVQIFGPYESSKYDKVL